MSDSPQENLEPTVDDVELSTRTRNTLKRNGLTRLIDVLETSDAELLKIPEIGERTLEEIHALWRYLDIPTPAGPPGQKPPRRQVVYPVEIPRRGAWWKTHRQWVTQNFATITAALHAGATVTALAKHYQVSTNTLRRVVEAHHAGIDLRSGEGRRIRKLIKARWQSPHPLVQYPLNLADRRDLADWIANFEWDQRAMEQWEDDGGPAGAR